MLKIAVAGGSIGGLCAGVALYGSGHDVEIYERAKGPLIGRGAGIVVQPQLLDLLQRHGGPDLPRTTCRYRQFLRPDHLQGLRIEMPMQLTSWHAIYETLLSVFPHDRYHWGRRLVEFADFGGRIVAKLDERGSIECDLLICAEGSRSETRRMLLPDVERHYAGYVAWRGTVDRSSIAKALVETFDHCFTICEGRSGGHILCYAIPGGPDPVEKGGRRFNWVWYVEVSAGSALQELLTDRNGASHDASVPLGMVPEYLVERLRAMAEQELHPNFSELVQSTTAPFVQAIFDVVVPCMAFGRVCLVGDAAFTLRPHPGAATAKAAADANALAALLPANSDDIPEALQIWNARQLVYGKMLSDLAIKTGERSVKHRTSSKTLADFVERFEGVSPYLPLA